MSAPRTEHEAAEHVRGELAGAANTLVLARSDDAGLDDLCPQLLLAEEPAETNLLWVAYTTTPDACMRKWLRHAGERPADVKVVSVGDVTRSAAARSAGSRASMPSTVDPLGNPADLTGLGISISEQLQAWSRDDNHAVVCFDSLTAALQYVDLETLYKFLHVLTGRFETVDADAHFHLDPDAHDEATVNTLKSLFDAVVERDADGEWRVARR